MVQCDTTGGVYVDNETAAVDGVHACVAEQWHIILERFVGCFV